MAGRNDTRSKPNNAINATCEDARALWRALCAEFGKENWQVNVPGLGEVTKADEFGWQYSRELPIPAFGGQTCRLVLSGYEEDDRKHDFHQAIANFLAAPESVLKAAATYIFQYCEDMNSYWEPEDSEYVAIDRPEDVWKHLRLGREPMIKRRAYADREVYVSVECECDWEPEHGLQIVFKNGAVVNKVGPYDGHLTNADAYANDSLEHIIYYKHA
jgi:hypothetical protein